MTKYKQISSDWLLHFHRIFQYFASHLSTQTWNISQWSFILLGVTLHLFFVNSKRLCSNKNKKCRDNYNSTLISFSTEVVHPLRPPLEIVCLPSLYSVFKHSVFRLSQELFYFCQRRANKKILKCGRLRVLYDLNLTWAEVLKISSTVFLLRHPPAVATIFAVSASLLACPSKFWDFSAKFWSLPGVPVIQREVIIARHRNFFTQYNTAVYNNSYQRNIIHYNIKCK